MASYVVVDLQVLGNPVGVAADFDFTAFVSCKTPDTAQVYAPAAGEVHCKLVKVMWMFPDIVLFERDCPQGGNTWLGTVYGIEEYTEFKLEAKHNQSGDEQVKRVACYPDGSYQEIPNY